MKKLLVICALLLGVTMAKAQEISIFDFGYAVVDEDYYPVSFETYSVNDCMANLIDKGFQVVRSEKFTYIGAGEFEYVGYERELRRVDSRGNSTTVLLLDVPDSIKFSDGMDMIDFLQDCAYSGLFIPEDKTYYHLKDDVSYGFGIYGVHFNYETYEVSFDVDVP
jgi:hypothetical protein